MAVTSAARVTCVKSPEPIVLIPACIRYRLLSGTADKYHRNAAGISKNAGISQRVDHRITSVLRATAASSPSIRLAVISAHTPAREVQTSVRKIRLGQ